MASRRARTKNLARSGHFETFCDRFSGLAASDRLRHRARKIAGPNGGDNSLFAIARSATQLLSEVGRVSVSYGTHTVGKLADRQRVIRNEDAVLSDTTIQNEIAHA